MLYDFEDRATPPPAWADVCVVGAGAAGIATAIALEHAGKSVILLEGGGSLLEQRSQDIYTSNLTGLPFQGIHDGRLRVLGGTTTEWGGQVLELDETDFAPRDHVPGSGWPIRKQDIARFYPLAEQFEGILGSYKGDSGRAALMQDLGQKPFSLGPEVSFALARFCPERDFARLYDKHLRNSERINLHLHASVTQLHLTPDRSSIAAVHIRSFGDRNAYVRAGSFVLCLGGIETTRLLLQPSAEGALPWQNNGVLGRHFQDHITCNGVPAEIYGVGPTPRYFGQIPHKGNCYQTKLELARAAQAEYGTLAVAGTIARHRPHNLATERAAILLRRVRQGRVNLTATHLAQAVRFMPGISTNWLSHRFGNAFGVWQKTMLQVHCEQSPTTASTITLDDQRDALGLYRTRLNWTISAHEIGSIRTYVRRMQEAFTQTNFGSIHPPDGFFHDDAVVVNLCRDSNHHMGSTRMSDSPREGVVDADLRLHGISNGYVCSSSVFPTGGFSNPTHTVIALAMRLAEHLAAQRDVIATHALEEEVLSQMAEPTLSESLVMQAASARSFEGATLEESI